MERFINIDDDYINIKKIVKIEEGISGDAEIYLSTSDREDSVYRVNMETYEVMDLIIEAQGDAKPVKKVAKKVAKKKEKKVAATNKFANLDVEGLF